MKELNNVPSGRPMKIMNNLLFARHNLASNRMSTLRDSRVHRGGCSQVNSFVEL
jgi:hypothetical protein